MIHRRNRRPLHRSPRLQGRPRPLPQQLLRTNRPMRPRSAHRQPPPHPPQRVRQALHPRQPTIQARAPQLYRLSLQPQDLQPLQRRNRVLIQLLPVLPNHPKHRAQSRRENPPHHPFIQPQDQLTLLPFRQQQFQLHHRVTSLVLNLVTLLHVLRLLLLSSRPCHPLIPPPRSLQLSLVSNPLLGQPKLRLPRPLIRPLTFLHSVLLNPHLSLRSGRHISRPHYHRLHRWHLQQLNPLAPP